MKKFTKAIYLKLTNEQLKRLGKACPKHMTIQTFLRGIIDSLNTLSQETEEERKAKELLRRKQMESNKLSAQQDI